MKRVRWEHPLCYIFALHAKCIFASGVLACVVGVKLSCDWQESYGDPRTAGYWVSAGFVLLFLFFFIPLSLNGWTFTEANVVTSVSGFVIISFPVSSHFYKCVPEAWLIVFGRSTVVLFSYRLSFSASVRDRCLFNSLLVLWKTAVSDCHAPLYKVTTNGVTEVKSQSWISN